jgi:type I restriction enzyme S subunit
MRGEGVVSSEDPWPSDWRRVRLEEAGHWLSGGTPSTSNDAYWGGSIPWISAASLKDFRIADSERKITELGAANGTRLVQKSTTLFVVRGMSLKSEFRIGVAEREVAFGQDCKAIISADGIDPHFLAYAIRVRTPEILRMVEETSHGTGRLDTRRLQDLKIGIPPETEEQLRIVAVHAAFERRIAAMKRVLSKLRAAEGSIVAQAMTKAPERIQLGGWVQRIEAGKSPLAEDTPAGDGEWGVLKVSAVQAGWFNPAENKVVRDAELINPAYEVRSGDLLMTRANTEELVGLACVAQSPPPRLMLSDKTLRLVIDHSVATPAFVELVLRSPVIRNRVRAAATGTSGSMKNIGQMAIRELSVPDVPLSEQNRIVAALAASNSQAGILERQIAKLRVIQKGLAWDLLSGKVRLIAS